jgi:hypothetical protein
MPDVFMIAHRVPVIRAAARNNVPAVYMRSEFLRDGGLVSYRPCSEASCHSSGCKTRQQKSPVTVVVISSDGEGDRTVESLESKSSRLITC